MKATLPKHAVIFDGDCAFCRHSVKWLRRLDWRHALSYSNFRDAGDPVVQAVPTTKDRLNEEMHLWPASRDRLYHGFGAFRFMAWRLPLLWLIAPFLYIPGVPWLGQKLYLWIAKHRYKLVPCQDGVCTIQQKKT
jgi:predicted DCC family thiol-disulfide oxidoreductase YuxK